MAKNVEICFGNMDYFQKIECCNDCEFFQSCKYYIDNPDDKLSQNSGLVSYENFSFSKEVSSNSTVIDDIDNLKPNCEKLLYSSDDLQDVVTFMLSIDEYTLEILSEMVDSKADTTAELARSLGVTRQAIHRKLIDACRITPKLRSLFASQLYRCKRILKDKERRKNNNLDNDKQLELDFYDYTEN